jgi:hypothetical protein
MAPPTWAGGGSAFPAVDCGVGGLLLGLAQPASAIAANTIGRISRIVILPHG